MKVRLLPKELSRAAGIRTASEEHTDVRLSSKVHNGINVLALEDVVDEVSAHDVTLRGSERVRREHTLMNL